MHFLKHPLLYILVPLCVLAIALSFYRFMVAGEYMVSYEGECDPAVESCFVGCEDEECVDVYYYSHVEKSAADVLAQCGPDITDCAEASVCLPTDTACTVTYCSSESLADGETCASLGTLEAPEGEGEEEEMLEEPLPVEQDA